MTITDVKIRSLQNAGRMRALVSVTFDGELAVHDLKVINKEGRLFVAMPSRKDDKGVFRDTVHPINQETRQAVEEAVIEAYKKRIEEENAKKGAAGHGEVQ